MPSSSALPQKFLRASSQAIAMPNGNATTVATPAMRSESRTAVHSSGVRESTGLGVGKLGHAGGVLPPPLAGEGWGGAYDVGRTRKVKPYCSNTALAVPERRNARYAAASGLAFAVAATG